MLHFGTKYLFKRRIKAMNEPQDHRIRVAAERSSETYESLIKAVKRALETAAPRVKGLTQSSHLHGQHIKYSYKAYVDFQSFQMPPRQQIILCHSFLYNCEQKSLGPVLPAHDPAMPLAKGSKKLF